MKFPLGLREQDKHGYELGWNDAVNAAVKAILATERGKTSAKELADEVHDLSSKSKP
jgi:hypothetical protein